MKNSRSVARSDLKGLKAFREDYPECRAVFLYRGDQVLEIEGIRVEPCEVFLKSLTIPARG